MIGFQKSEGLFGLGCTKENDVTLVTEKDGRRGDGKYKIVQYSGRPETIKAKIICGMFISA